MSISPGAVKIWMKNALRDAAEEYRDSAGEIQCGPLAEDAACAFGQDHDGGWLDDSDHWVWDVAVEAATWWDRDE